MSNTLRKTLAGVAALAILALGFAASASAACYSHTVTLRKGSMGSQVMAMQSVVGASADGKFGPMTEAAVKAFQASKGLVADGIVGPMTGAKLAAACTTDSNDDEDDNDSDTSLNGDFGTIDDVNELSQYSNEEVGEGEEDVIVLGFEVEASNDGDVEIDSVRVSFDPTGNIGSDNLDDYVDEVTVWFGDEMVGSADVDDFSQNSSDLYIKTIALDNGVVVEADETEKFYVAVTAVNSFDSSDISGSNDSWTVDVENIRFVDGSGVVTTETGYDLDGMDVEVDFVSFSDSADTELKISKDSDSPDDQVVMVDEDSDTDDVVLLKGKLKLDGDSDVVLEEFPVTFTTTGDSVAAVTNSVTLEIDGEEYTESVTATSSQTTTITFDDMNFDISAGDTIEFEVRADINDLNNSGVTATDFDEGDTLKAEVTSTNRDYMDVENEEGDQLDDSSEKSGTANGEAQEFRTDGIMVSLVSTSTDVTAGNSTNDDLGQFTIKFKVKAMGDAIYVSSTATASLNTTGNGTVVGVDRSGTATIGGVSVTVVNTTDDDLTAVGNYLIEEGEEETFEMTATVQLPTAGAAGQYRALIRAIDWATTDTTTYTSYESNLDSFKTSYRALN